MEESTITKVKDLEIIFRYFENCSLRILSVSIFKGTVKGTGW